MSHRHPDHAKTPEISAAEFPALRDFLRGYFHEDLLGEYGSAEAAVRQFRKDADEQQRKAVAEDWTRLMERVPWAAMNAAIGKLGSAYEFESADEFKRVVAIFREYAR
jgi:hypothetical protein